MEKQFRINQEDISNLLAEKKFEDITQIFEWLEKEINNGVTIKYYSSYLISDNFPSKEFSTINDDYKKWKENISTQRKALLERINKIKFSGQ